VVRTSRQGVFGVGAGGGSVAGFDPGPAAGGGVGGRVVILRSIAFSASSFSVNCWIARWGVATLGPSAGPAVLRDGAARRCARRAGVPAVARAMGGDASCAKRLQQAGGAPPGRPGYVAAPGARASASTSSGEARESGEETSAPSRVTSMATSPRGHLTQPFVVREQATRGPVGRIGRIRRRRHHGRAPAAQPAAGAGWGRRHRRRGRGWGRRRMQHRARGRAQARTGPAAGRRPAGHEGRGSGFLTGMRQFDMKVGTPARPPAARPGRPCAVMYSCTIDRPMPLPRAGIARLTLAAVEGFEDPRPVGNGHTDTLVFDVDGRPGPAGCATEKRIVAPMGL